MTKRKEYFIGLNMETSSVGWAVTDTSYNLMRAKGKDLWGARMFTEASTAKKRQTNRTARRGKERKKNRVIFLKGIFVDEIMKVDPSFYERLSESFYLLEDREEKIPYTLFADEGYTDVDFYEQYPSMSHLIKELIDEREGKKPHDVRLVFLACLNIFKHRGHFLNDGLSETGIEDIEDLCEALSQQYDEYCENTDCSNLYYNFNEVKSLIKDTLCDKKTSAKEKKITLTKELNLSSKQKNIKGMVRLICGLDALISDIFPKDTYSEEEEKLRFTFKSSDFDAELQKIQPLLDQEEYDIVLLLKKIYDASVIYAIMGPHKFLSQARVESYEKHKADLALLKSLYKEYNKGKYAEMFYEMAPNNYCAYVGKTSSNKKAQSGSKKTRLQRRGAKCNREDFYKKIVSDLKDVPDEKKEYVLNEIEKESFLPKQLTNENCVIPYQLHGAELKRILENASGYLSFLNEVDETGLSKKQQIIDMFEFRIPYYVGPLYLNENVSTNAWVARKEPGKVLPWNFSEKIDERESAEKFIEKMVRRCTYLNDECVLPNNSLLYEKFKVLDELNNLRLDGEKISPETKKKIFDGLFMSGKKNITGKMLREFLCKSGMADKDTVISGIDKDFKNALCSYGIFKKVFGVNVLTDSQERAAEDIIKWGTVYKGAKKFLKGKIEENYGPKSPNPLLNSEQIDLVLCYGFSGWGKLSRELLELEGTDKETGEVLSLISRMWEENHNLMELLSYRYTYREEIAKRTNTVEKTLMDLEFEDLGDLYASAPVKRMLWQTIHVLKEIYEIMGYAPKKIFIDMARGGGEKNVKTKSRKKAIEKLLKDCKDKSGLLEVLEKYSDADLRSKKRYLYFMQKGRCMYSGNSIRLADLFSNDYDIDHIYPKKVVKDDSLDNNLVLVEKTYNSKKDKNYPISSKWQASMKDFWAELKEQKFLNKEKFERLTRTDGFSDDELAGFINRQLVETRQAAKIIANLAEKTFTDPTTGEKLCRIVYVKAGNVSDFRQKFAGKYDKDTGKTEIVNPELVKCRIINDLHNAYDAYLNIVVGNVYDVKFTNNPYNFVKEYRKQTTPEQKERYHMDKIFSYDVKRKDESAWICEGDNKTLDTVLKVMRKNTPIITRMNFEGHGKLSDTNILSADKAREGRGYIDIKTSNKKLDKSKYGGYSSLSTHYFFLVEHTKKGKRIRSIESLPLLYKNKCDTTEKLEQWCRDTDNGLGLVEPNIILPEIKIGSKLRINGFEYYLTGRSADALVMNNAVQLKLDKYWGYYLKKISDYSDDTPCDIITKENNEKMYDVLLSKSTTGIFSKRRNSISELLMSGKALFLDLSLKDQVTTIKEIVGTFAMGVGTADLTLIGGSKNSGKMSISKNISNYEEVVLINQSTTGLYENEVDLLRI